MVRAFAAAYRCGRRLAAAAAAAMLLPALPGLADFEAGKRAYEARDFETAHAIMNEGGDNGNVKFLCAHLLSRDNVMKEFLS